jgi:dTDP-4-amino-4,6-dideoxygalactose transaminase
MIFNSLGSNYNLRFALWALMSNDLSNGNRKLMSYLSQKYGGKATVVYKGREALLLALRAAKLQEGDYVAVNGFTCFAVYEAVKKELNIEYVDVANESLHFGVKELKKALESNPRVRAVIVQNTLGAPVDILGIKKICDEKDLVLIEDVAHSVGAQYKNGSEAGTQGDFVALSFGRDKLIDAVSGGALVIRNKRYQNYEANRLERVHFLTQIREMLYPILTWKIRKMYKFGLGKGMHYTFSRLGLLRRGLGPELSAVHKLPNWYAKLALKQYKSLDSILAHRRKIADIYASSLNPNIMIKDFISKIELSANLRFPILVQDRMDLIKFLSKSNIHVSDIWYDAPIAPKKYAHLSNYNGECPTAEEISNRILNLPTHINISASDARKISNEVNKWLKSE